MKFLKAQSLTSFCIVTALVVLLSCDAIDVTDPNFNDQNIGVWEDWTGGNDYTYIEITSSEVTFYFYNRVYRCSEIKRYAIQDIQANGVYTLQPLNESTGNESITMGFSRNDRWLHVRDLSLSELSTDLGGGTSQAGNSDDGNEVETQIFNASVKNVDDLEDPCGSYPFLGVWEQELSEEVTGYLHITEEMIEVIAYLVPQSCYNVVRLDIESITEVQQAYELVVQEEGDTTGETLEQLEFFIFPDYMLLKRIENGFAVTETYLPSNLDVSGELSSCSNR